MNHYKLTFLIKNRNDPASKWRNVAKKSYYFRTWEEVNKMAETMTNTFNPMTTEVNPIIRYI